jgi:hypothetical protein
MPLEMQCQFFSNYLRMKIIQAQEQYLDILSLYIYIHIWQWQNGQIFNESYARIRRLSLDRNSGKGTQNIYEFIRKIIC